MPPIPLLPADEMEESVVTLQSQGRSRERILLFGMEGTGKSEAAKDIAARIHPNKLFVIDNDNAWDRMLEGPTITGDEVAVECEWRWDETQTHKDDDGNRQPGDWTVDDRWVTEGGNIWVFHADGGWLSNAHAIRTVREEAGPDDWCCIDSGSALWDDVQEFYSNSVFDKSMASYFLQVRLEIEKAKKDAGSLGAFDGWTDWCVDAQTRILTAEGWKSHDQLVIGEPVFTLDTNLGTSLFSPLLGLHVGEARPREMVAMRSTSHDSLTTPSHRWWVERHGALGFTPRWTTSKEMTRHDRVTRSAPRSDAPTNPKYTDAFVELVAWWITEGWLTHKTDRPNPGSGIGQKDRDNVARIRGCLLQISETGWSERTRADGLTSFHLGTWVTALLLDVAPDKTPSYEFLMSLTTSQTQLFVKVCIDGDGTTGSGGNQTFHQNDSGRVARFEFACALADIPTRTWLFTDLERLGSREGYEVRLLRSAGVWPKQTQTQRHTVSTEMYDGIVWCPVTEQGTWLAQRNGTIYFTGNSVINPLYKQAVMRFLVTPPCHLIITAEQANLDGKSDDKEAKALYSMLMVKPRGQKRMGHNVQTVIHMRTDRGGDYYATTVKDRGGREKMVNENITERGISDWYLEEKAGWRETDTSSAPAPSPKPSPGAMAPKTAGTPTSATSSAPKPMAKKG